MVVVKIKEREAIPEADNRSAKARPRGISARRKLMEADGGSLSAEEAAGELGISKAAILELYHRGQIIAWDDGRQNAARFPVWQFKDRELLDGLEETLKILSAGCRLDDFRRMLFFLLNQGFLEGKRPLDCLRAGEVNKVLQAAEGYGGNAMVIDKTTADVLFLNRNGSTAAGATTNLKSVYALAHSG
jgi:hypothetical protein